MGRLCSNGIELERLAEHKEFIGIIYAQHVLSGRWKFLIMWLLKNNTYRFGELKKLLTEISQSSLTKQLRELEEDGLINREVFPEVPPRVVYSLTNKGEKLVPILVMLEKFGQECTEEMEKV